MKKIKFESFGEYSASEIIAMFVGALAFAGLLWAMLSLSIVVGGVI